MKETVKLRQWTPLGQSWVWVLAAFVKCVVVVVVVTTQPFQSFTHLSCYFTYRNKSRKRERERDEEIVCNINNNINNNAMTAI